MQALLQVGLTAALITAALGVAARRWRTGDPAGWHTVWLIVATVSLCAVPLALMWPAPSAGWSLASWLPAQVVPPAAWPWLATAYTIGLVVMVGRLGLGILHVHRLSVCARVIPESDCPVLADILGPDAHLCRVHPAMTVPVAAGGCIVLPEAWTGWTFERLSAVLHHEHAHLVRHDGWSTFLAGVHLAVFWPSPAAWWLLRHIRLTADRACDVAAANVVGGVACARALVESARDLVDHPSNAPHPALGAHRDLSTRIDALLASAPGGPRLPRWFRVGVGVLVLMLLTTAAQWRQSVRVSAASASPLDRGNTSHAARHAARHSAH